MFARILPLLAALGALAPAAAHAQETQPKAHVTRAPNPRARTGAILTTVGGSMLMTAPLVVLASDGIIAASSHDFSAMGPIVLGSFAGAVIGIGILVPGLVMLATCKPHDRVVPLPDTRQAAWTEFRPPPSGLRMVTVPVFAGRF